jgi:hypothetical protein
MLSLNLDLRSDRLSLPTEASAAFHHGQETSVDQSVSYALRNTYYALRITYYSSRITPHVSRLPFHS